MDDLRLRIQQLLQQLNERVFGKEHVIALSLLSAVAGESIFLLGPPGVAKSMVARRLKLAFRRGEAFEYLMSRFSTPDEIFGPVSSFVKAFWYINNRLGGNGSTIPSCQY